MCSTRAALGPSLIASLTLTAGPAAAAEAASEFVDLALILAVTLLLAASVILFLLWCQGRRTEAALRSEAAMLTARMLEERALFLGAPAAVIGWSDDGRVRSLGIRELFSFDGSQDIFEIGDLGGAIHSEHLSELRDAVSDLRNTGTGFAMTVRSHSGDRWYRIHGQHDDDGPMRSVVWFRDITDSHRSRVDAETETEMARNALAALELFLDHLPIPAYRRNDKLDMTWCNAAYASMLNKDKKALVAAGGAEIEPPLARNRGRKLATAALSIGETQRETVHFVVDGQRRALEIVEVPNLPDGGIAGYVRDVTDIEEIDTELRRHVDAHSEVLNNLSTAISIFGPDKRLSYYNRAFVDLWGLDDDWLGEWPQHGEILDELREQRRIPEQADFPAFKQEAMKLYTDLLETTEQVIYTPDGRVLRRVVSPHPFGGLLYLDEDVTDSLIMERSYNTLIEVQRETLDNLYEGIALYGGDGRLKLSNPAFASMWGLDRRMLDNEPHVSEVVDAARELLDHFGNWPKLRERLIGQATSRESGNGRMERPDGVVIDYAQVALPDGNKLFSYIDITDSVNVERALRDRNQALETADKLKTEFLANVSYELRTPLNVIIGFAEVLVNEYFGALNDRQREYGHDILNSSHHLLSLINDILDLASIEAGRLELELEEVDLPAAVENVMALVRERAQKQRLHVELDCPETLGAFEADERRIKQVLFHLVSNSVKFTPPGGRIEVLACREGDEIRLEVRDTGIGIAEEDQELVFNSFQRGSNAEHQHSAGLGLSLVKRFVELHGGTVEIDSALDQGTTVICTLPTRQRQAVELEPAAAAQGN